MSDWQPIETAPRDGSAILSYAEGNRWPYDVAEWDDVDGKLEAWSLKERGEALKWPHWLTHWQPLPALPTADPAGWSHIAFAPKDGTRILVAAGASDRWGDGELFVTAWCDHNKHNPHEDEPYWAWGGFAHDRTDDLTHWRPLPAPPEGVAEWSPVEVSDLWPFNGEQPKSLSAALYSGLAKRAVAGEYDRRRLPEDLANAAALIEDLQGKLDAALGSRP